MGQPFRWPEPRWLTDIDDPDEKRRAESRFYVALAALYLTPKGNLGDLTDLCGGSPSRVRVTQHRGVASPEMAIAIEAGLGRDLFPRELFRPDLFLIEGGE